MSLFTSILLHLLAALSVLYVYAVFREKGIRLFHSLLNVLKEQTGAELFSFPPTLIVLEMESFQTARNHTQTLFTLAEKDRMMKGIYMKERMVHQTA
jgi:hypothetical protein